MPATTPQLVAVLRQHQLLEPDQLTELDALAALFADARALAKELLQRGWVTPYQANQLLQDKGAELVLGNSILLDRLGEGGMGAVFRARHRMLGRVVALKLIRKERLTKPDAIRRFRREIQAAAQLNHPNIVLAFDADEANGAQFFTMEFVPGTDLEKLVQENGPLPVAEACDYIRQAALGLQHAYAVGLVHRDIKPSNLLLATDQGRGVNENSNAEVSAQPIGNRLGATVKILDMGLARLDTEGTASNLTQEGTVMGTPDFLSPEQALESHTVDIRSDLYSLGCTLYFLLTGKVPFPGGSATEKLLKHQLQEPTPVEKLRPEVPPIVATVVRTLMAKRPEGRFRTPAEVAERLAGIGSQLSAPMVGASPAGGSRKPKVGGRKPLPEAGQSTPAESAQAGATRVAPYRLRQAAKQRRSLGLTVGGALGAIAALGLFLWLLVGSKSTPPPTAVSQGPANPGASQAAPSLDLPQVPTGAPLSPLALVQQPALLAGVRSWTLDTGANRGTLGAVTPSPDGRWFAGGSMDGTVRVHDFATGRLVHALVGHWAHFPSGGLLAALVFAPDGRMLVSVDNTDMWWLWNVETGKSLWSRRINRYRPAWSPDGRTLAVGTGSNKVLFIDPATGNTTGELATAPDSRTHLVSWSADGMILAVGNKLGAVGLWDVASGKLVREMEGPGKEPIGLAVAPNGLRVAASYQGDPCRVWEAPAGKLLFSLPDVDWPAFSLVWSPDSQLLGAYDGKKSAICFWDSTTGKPAERVLKATSNGPIMSWSADGKTLFSATPDSGAYLHAAIRDITTGQTIPFTPSNRYIASMSPRVAWSPDGQWLATGDAGGSRVRLWSAVTGQYLRALSGPRMAGIPAVAFSPNGKTVAAGGADTAVHLWDLATGQTWKNMGHTAPIDCVAWSADSQLLATGGQDKNVRLWDTKSDRTLFKLEGHANSVGSVAFAPDNRTLASADGQSVRLWDIITGNLVHTLSKAGGPLAWSSDGKYLACMRVTSNPRTVVLWDSASGQEAKELVQPARPYSLWWSPDSRTLAASLEDGRLQEWDVAAGKPGQTIEGAGPGIFSPDGRYVARALYNSVRLWDASTGRGCGALVLLADKDQWLAVGPDGYYRGSEPPASDLIYVVQTDAGQQTLTPDEFAQKYGWKNDPNRVRLRAP